MRVAQGLLHHVNWSVTRIRTRNPTQYTNTQKSRKPKSFSFQKEKKDNRNWAMQSFTYKLERPRERQTLILTQESQEEMQPWFIVKRRRRKMQTWFYKRLVVWMVRWTVSMCGRIEKDGWIIAYQIGDADVEVWWWIELLFLQFFVWNVTLFGAFSCFRYPLLPAFFEYAYFILSRVWNTHM